MSSLKYRIAAALGIMIFILITKGRHNSFEDNLPIILIMLSGITIGALIYFSAYKLFFKIIKTLFPKKTTHFKSIFEAEQIKDKDKKVEEDEEKYMEIKATNNNIVDRTNKSAKSVITRNR